MRHSLAAALCVALYLSPVTAHARATFKITEHGTGFDDKTPTTPVGGNEGVTLGEQRRNALAHAFELWSRSLDSVVPIDVDVELSDLGCDAGSGVILGQAGPVGLIGDLDAPLADRSLLYPIALANSLAGEDLAPEAPDIRLTINTAPDDRCRSRTRGYYYGFDGKAGEANDLVAIVLHELAHGLGFSSAINPTTGELLADRADTFSAHIYDQDLRRSWSQLTAAERARSAQNVWRVSWDGAQTQRVAAAALPLPQPRLELSPPVRDWSGLVADSAMGSSPTVRVSGPLLLVQSCSTNQPGFAGGGFVALLTRCSGRVVVDALAAAGAVAVLIAPDAPYDYPPLPLELESDDRLHIPLLTLTASDARALQLALSAGPTTASIDTDPSERLGVDAAGRPRMFASVPVSRGSSISHVDPSLRPNQLMEPFATPQQTHDLSLTRAMLQDIGWSARCGDGHLDPTEECDRGAGNDDTVANGCRTDCRQAHCGDGVRDDREDCDDGAGNSDRRPGACRTSCRKASCGDGVLDPKEGCDDGKNNDDSRRDACRTTCRVASCGDGVLDALEQCDDGKNNDDKQPGACRSDCRKPRCGDGVQDSGEECDDGLAADPARCRKDCTKARCGDGVVDDGEACDGSPGCSSSCQPIRLNRSAGKQLRVASLRDAAAESGDTSPTSTQGDGCGCRLAPGPRPGRPALFLSVLALGLLLRARFSRRRDRTSA